MRGAGGARVSDAGSTTGAGGRRVRSSLSMAGGAWGGGGASAQKRARSASAEKGRGPSGVGAAGQYRQQPQGARSRDSSLGSHQRHSLIGKPTPGPGMSRGGGGAGGRFGGARPSTAAGGGGPDPHRLSGRTSYFPSPALLGKPAGGAAGRVSRISATQMSGGEHRSSVSKSGPPSTTSKAARPGNAQKAENITTIIAFLCSQPAADGKADNQAEYLRLSADSLKKGSQTDFVKVYQYLMQFLDPSYVVDKKTRLEEEVPRKFKGLGYPLELKKSQLQAVAPAWAYLLGALAWLTDLVKYGLTVSGDDVLQLDPDQQTENTIRCAEMYFHQQAFKQFMDYEDSEESMTALLENYEQSVTLPWQNKLQQLREEAAQLDEQERALTELRDAVAKSEGEAEQLGKTNQERVVYVQQMEDYLVKQAAVLQQSKQAVDVQKQEEAELLAKIETQREIVDAQSISSADFKRLVLTKSNLQSQLRKETEHLDGLRQELWDLQTELAGRNKELADLWADCRSKLGELPEARFPGLAARLPELGQLAPNVPGFLAALDSVLALQNRAAGELAGILTERERVATGLRRALEELEREAATATANIAYQAERETTGTASIADAKREHDDAKAAVIAKIDDAKRKAAYLSNAKHDESFVDYEQLLAELKERIPVREAERTREMAEMDDMTRIILEKYKLFKADFVAKMARLERIKKVMEQDRDAALAVLNKKGSSFEQ